ncbi:copper chaperone PCu(A)C [Streptomyces sp. NBC_00201]|uniref:copper chaperone PCu(A)C n=1 Tax=Streptomyces sp. NBC_00201 TaxID=2975679 RepID=UPI00225451D0|nr:copper chaperone PCu(A)C [Streptomyces sp. NBC_00201]MCX5249513.1 copper chaperone PCu(A)C [Streptomyces sp. NBC_00201]
MRKILPPMSSRIGDRRRLRDTALAALVPVAACSVALAGLTAWTGTGRAGTPPRMRVTEGRVLLPSAGIPETAAFFRVANEGGSPDRLIRVTSPDTPGGITLSRHRMNEGNGAYRDSVGSVAVPAGGNLAMSPTGVDLTVSAPSGQWRPGDLVSFTLEFRRSGRVKVLAVVVRPKDAPQRRVQEPRSGAVSWQ